MGYTDRMGRADAGRRTRVVRVVAMAVLVAAAATVLVVPVDDADVVRGVIHDHHPYCVALQEPAWGRTDDGSSIDAVLFIDGFTDAAAVAAIEEEVRADAEVTSATLFSQEDAYEEFQTQFADDPFALQSVDADILPTSVRVALDAEVAAAPGAWARSWEDHEDVVRVATSADVLRHGPRVADVLLGPFLEAHPSGIVSLYPPRFEPVLEAAPDELVRDLIALEVVVVGGAIFGPENVRIRPATVEAADRVLDHAESVCGLDRPQTAGSDEVGV